MATVKEYEKRLKQTITENRELEQNLEYEKRLRQTVTYTRELK